MANEFGLGTRTGHLTEGDNLGRMTDVPERMQLSTSSLWSTATPTLHADCNLDLVASDAATWVATRISLRIAQHCFRPNASHFHLFACLILAISRGLELMLAKNYEVPYIHTHWRDLISHFDPTARVSTELLSRGELWRVGALRMKSRALTERKQAYERWPPRPCHQGEA